MKKGPIDWATCHVEKLGYSGLPWRIITAEGEQCWQRGVYPGSEPMLKGSTITVPIGFSRRRDAVAALEKLRAEGRTDG